MKLNQWIAAVLALAAILLALVPIVFGIVVFISDKYVAILVAILLIASFVFYKAPEIEIKLPLIWAKIRMFKVSNLQKEGTSKTGGSPAPPSHANAKGEEGPEDTQRDDK